MECKRDNASSPIVPVKEDFQTVNRFESHGGGWGYSGHSVEAIRFMCDTDILLGKYSCWCLLYGIDVQITMRESITLTKALRQTHCPNMLLQIDKPLL